MLNIFKENIKSLFQIISISMFHIPPSPLTSRGRLFFLLNIIGLIAIFGIAVYGYLSIEGTFPQQFGFDGEPKSYGSSGVFLVVGPSLAAASIVILLITYYRFSFVNKYPQYLNLPGFFIYLPKIPVEKRSYFFNRYFESILLIGAVVSLEMTFIMYSIFVSATLGYLPNFFVPSIIVLSIAIVVIIIYFANKVTKEMKNFR